MEKANTILIVDDEPIEREILEAILLDMGFNLAFASNGQEALKKAAELMPDLILLDVMMPGVDGFQVCQQLRADPYLAEVPIVMVTALDDRDSVLRGLEAGADDFVIKPFDQVELQIRVRSITRLNRYRRLLLERTYRQEAEQEIHRREAELRLLNHVMTAAAATLNPHDILYIACEALAQTFDFPQATALVFNEDRTQFKGEVEYLASWLYLGQDQISAHKSDFDAEVPLVAHFSSEELLTHKTPWAVVEGQVEPGLEQIHAVMREYGVGSLLIVPILRCDQVAALIELKTRNREQFYHRDLALAHSIAMAVGQAMQTAQLHQKLQDQVDELMQTVARQTEELQTGRDHSRTILEALHEAVIMIGLDGTMQYANSAAETLTGYNRSEMLGKSWQMWQNEYQSPEFYVQLEDTVRTGRIWRGQVVNKCKNGSFYKAETTVVPLLNPHQLGPPTSFVCIQRDIVLLNEVEYFMS